MLYLKWIMASPSLDTPVIPYKFQSQNKSSNFQSRNSRQLGFQMNYVMQVVNTLFH